jgi:hypothetical protein
MNAAELKDALDRALVNPDRYDLAGGPPLRSEGIVLVRAVGKWEIRHFERGSWDTMASYQTESEACAKFLQIASDPFYRS